MAPSHELLQGTPYEDKGEDSFCFRLDSNEVLVGFIRYKELSIQVRSSTTTAILERQVPKSPDCDLTGEPSPAAPAPTDLIQGLHSQRGPCDLHALV